VGLVLGGMLASGLVAASTGVDALEHLPHIPACLFHALSGVPCPGCGMTRALLLLGQLRFAEALALHPLAPGMGLLMIWALVGSPGRSWLTRRSTVRGALALVLVVWIARIGLGVGPG